MLLFDAEVEKYCPDNMIQIKVIIKNILKSFINSYFNEYLLSDLTASEISCCNLLSLLPSTVPSFSYIADSREGGEAVPGLDHLD